MKSLNKDFDVSSFNSVSSYEELSEREEFSCGVQIGCPLVICFGDVCVVNLF
jgi:hypothetical protein